MKPKKQTKLVIGYGFTLIELLVVIAIMALLATVFIAGFNQSNKEKAVVLGTDVLISSVRSAQNGSLNPQAIPGSTCLPNGIPAELHLQFASSETSFALQGLDKCGGSALLQSFNLPINVSISPGNAFLVDYGGGPVIGNSLDIKFLPPFGQLSVSLSGGSFQPFKQATISLQSSDASVIRSVFLDGISGRVDTNAVILPPSP